MLRCSLYLIVFWSFVSQYKNQNLFKRATSGADPIKKIYCHLKLYDWLKSLAKIVVKIRFSAPKVQD